MEDTLNKQQSKAKKQPDSPKNKHFDISEPANYKHNQDKEKLDQLMKRNQLLNDQIEYLEKKLKESEEKEKTLKKPFSSDILKCMFSQVMYIDSSVV